MFTTELHRNFSFVIWRNVKLPKQVTEHAFNFQESKPRTCNRKSPILSINMSINLTNTIPWTHAKRQIRSWNNLRFIFIVKPLRIEAIRFRIVLRVALQRHHRYQRDDPLLHQETLLVGIGRRDQIVLDAETISLKIRRPLAQGLCKNYVRHWWYGSTGLSTGNHLVEVLHR
jgi:hypothetical protein